MANSLADLATRMEAISNGVVSNSDNAVRTVVIEIGKQLAEDTPVDTSRARSNWQGSVGSPVATVLYPAPQKPPSADTGAAMARLSTFNAAQQYRGEKEGVYITNNLDYIGELNNGSSRQAPTNFVEMAVSKALRVLRNVRLVR